MLVQDILTDLKSCRIKKDMRWASIIHAKALESRNNNMYVLNALISMYGKCGSIVHARSVFDFIQKANVVSWNSILLGYADNGEGQTALALFSIMKTTDCIPNAVTYVAALKACMPVITTANEISSLELLRKIHSEAGHHLDQDLRNMLIDMYSKCGSLPEALAVFEDIKKPDVVSWNSLIFGYAENGEWHAALDLFSKMKAGGCAPDTVTYLAVLKACTSLAANGDASTKCDCLERGRVICSELGPHLNHYVQGTLIDLFSKCGSMSESQRIFESMKNPDLVSWNALLLGYADNGEENAALELFSRMKTCVFAPDSFTYVAALKACTSLAAKGDDNGKQDCLGLGRNIHLEVGYHLNEYVKQTLVEMYIACGSMVEARQVLDSVQSPNVMLWNAVLLGYVENGDGLAALELLSRMKTMRSCIPDSVTYVAALKACALTGTLSAGRKFHSEIREFSTQIVTCLVDFYAKCGSMVEAQDVFDLHSQTRHVSTWTALLAGYARFGETGPVFKLFEGMQREGLQPDSVTFVCLLLCCSHAGLVETAWEYLEAMRTRYKVVPTVIHYNCMIDVLGRANQLNKARQLIRKMPCRPDGITWMTLLGACCKWKNLEIGKEAFHALVEMGMKNMSAYVLMAHIYGSRDMREEREELLKTRIKFLTTT